MLPVLPGVGTFGLICGVAMVGSDLALDAGLLGDLPSGRLGQCLAGLDVPLGQAPVDPPGPVATGNDRDPGGPLVDVDDDASSRALLDGGQASGLTRGRLEARVAHHSTVTSTDGRLPRAH